MKKEADIKLSAVPALCYQSSAQRYEVISQFSPSFFFSPISILFLRPATAARRRAMCLRGLISRSDMI